MCESCSNTLNINASPTELKRHFNKLYDLTSVVRSLVDLGAGSAPSYFQWSKISGIAEAAQDDGVRMTFVGVAADDNEKFLEGVNFILDAVQQHGLNARYFLVFTHMNRESNFDIFRTKEIWKKIEMLQEKFGLTIIEVPYLGVQSLVWMKVNSFHEVSLLGLLHDLLEVVKSNIQAERNGTEPVILDDNKPEDAKKLNLLRHLGLDPATTSWRGMRPTLTQEWTELQEWIKAVWQAQHHILKGLIGYQG